MHPSFSISRESFADTLPYLGIDFEGAGQVAGHSEEPVQIGLCLLEPCPDKPQEASISQRNCFVSYLRPRTEISPAAQRVHGISAEQVRNAPSLTQLWPELEPRFAQGILTAYGKATEKRYLESLPALNLEPFVDVLPLMRSAFPNWPEHSLGYCVKRLNLLEEVQQAVAKRSFHDALFDAAATLILLRYLLQHWKSQEITLSDLLNPSLSRYYKQRSSSSPNQSLY